MPPHGALRRYSAAPWCPCGCSPLLWLPWVLIVLVALGLGVVAVIIASCD